MSQIFKQFQISRETPGYWRVTFDNPPINLFDRHTVIELEQLLDQLETDPELRVVVFESANPDFFVAHFGPAAGVDSLLEPRPNGLLPWVDVVERMVKLPLVTIAAIRGRARGVGGEFAIACDIRFGSLEKAILSQIEVGVGLFPGGGALERLPLIVGRGRALEIILSADDFDAATAERYGWINRAIPDAEFGTFVDKFARRVASFDKQALAEAKHLLNKHSDTATAADLNETHKIFFSAFAWPGAIKRAPQLRELGSGKPGDFELNYGTRVGHILEK